MIHWTWLIGAFLAGVCAGALVVSLLAAAKMGDNRGRFPSQ